MNKITSYYIGGRCGLVLEPTSVFRDDFTDVFFEADETCIPQLEQICKTRSNEFYIFPVCLSDKKDEVPFYIKYDPFTSSFFRTNPKYESYYTPMQEHDYLVSETNQVVETRTLKTIDLDSIVENNKVPKPDYLAVDTQGSEYNILVGAEKTLDSVLGIEVEVSFTDLNEGQPLFGDVYNLLKDRFYLTGFLEMYGASPYRAPIGLRGKGFQVAARALFLRDVNTIHDYMALRKLAFLAITYSQIEYGLQCIMESERLTPVEDDQFYMKFITEFSKATKGLPEMYPKTFVDVFPTFEGSNKRFQLDNNWRTPVLKKSSVDTNLYSTEGTPEYILSKYGLDQQAQLLAKIRREY